MILEFCVIVNRLKSVPSREINNIFLYIDYETRWKISLPFSFLFEGMEFDLFILCPIRWIVPHWTSEISAQPVGVNSPDPDLDIRRGKGGGAGHPEPEIREGRSPKQLFRPFGPQFGLKIRGLGDGVGRSYGSATGCKKGTLESRLQQT